ncbi:Alpha/Beta hydrolase protein [Chaetomium fimeti]|uniref:Carboxylic ester hydrolase n=1 Tax=Chaetomium fimeti TaxID=1854472 RepID=A0AAE0H867_9PEZI|nr:Alpha/Beta hydrolase protein [Chaetomium fimeti]
MRCLPLIIALAAPLAAASACRPPKWTVGQTVHTSSGPVEGHAASTASEVSEYLGIPYAQPPVGSLRFQPPVRYTGETKISGKSFGAACFPSNISAFDADFPQELIDVYGITEVGRRILATITNPGIPVSEDCLTLNVWTKPQTGEKRKAVMVYIHGGSFVSGSSAVPAYNGQFFADQEDIVLVTINYRLTFFGFPGNPHGHQNPGLLDQRMAVEWVRDNIASFGGDPKRITLFGESAGGASVDHYSFAWPHDPIVAGLISMSGTASGIAPRSAALATELWYNTTTALGCGDATTPPSTLLTCMQSAPAPSLIATLLNTIDSPNSVPYSPTIDSTLVFPHHHPSNNTTNTTNTTHPTAPLPLLIGTTDNESGLFRLFVPPQPSLTPAQETTFWHHQNQHRFVCPAAARANHSSHRDGNPTWRYRWHGVFPNTALSTTPPSGAYHDSEVAVLFGTVDEGLVGNTKGQGEVGRYMRGAWAAFARDPAKGLGRYGREFDGVGGGMGEGWPRYVAGEETLVRLGWEGRAGASVVRGDLYDDGC